MEELARAIDGIAKGRRESAGAVAVMSSSASMVTETAQLIGQQSQAAAERLHPAARLPRACRPCTTPGRWSGGGGVRQLPSGSKRWVSALRNQPHSGHHRGHRRSDHLLALNARSRRRWRAGPRVCRGRRRVRVTERSARLPRRSRSSSALQEGSRRVAAMGEGDQEVALRKLAGQAGTSSPGSRRQWRPPARSWT